MAKMTTVASRDYILANKSKALVNSRIYIESDLTERERFISFKVREKIRLEKSKGNRISSGHEKVLLNDQWLHWDDTSGDFILPSNHHPDRPAPLTSTSTSTSTAEFIPNRPTARSNFTNTPYNSNHFINSDCNNQPNGPCRTSHPPTQHRTGNFN